mmetsp:Transcript_20641/g.36997  ORF Transcript_20641/g.36997 Transcript_20641/m.36997 type:complete len:86 (-) Transcript_20641:428-685(-)
MNSQGTAAPKTSRAVASAPTSGPLRRVVAGRASSAQQRAGSNINFYTDDTPGIKVSPVAVITMSLGFIAFITILHIFGKLTGRSN